jgi:hypothetical protein
MVRAPLSHSRLSYSLTSSLLSSAVWDFKFPHSRYSSCTRYRWKTARVTHRTEWELYSCHLSSACRTEGLTMYMSPSLCVLETPFCSCVSQAFSKPLPRGSQAGQGGKEAECLLFILPFSPCPASSCCMCSPKHGANTSWSLTFPERNNFISLEGTKHKVGFNNIKAVHQLNICLRVLSGFPCSKRLTIKLTPKLLNWEMYNYCLVGATN